jgi:hypothetical protein
MRLTTLPQSMRRLSGQCGILSISQPNRPPRTVAGIALLYFYFILKGITSNAFHGDRTYLDVWPYLYFSCLPNLRLELLEFWHGKRTICTEVLLHEYYLGLGMPAGTNIYDIFPCSSLTVCQNMFIQASWLYRGTYCILLFTQSLEHT